MGKVKVKVIGDEQQEKEQKLEQKKKNEAKKQAKGLNMGGGQRINAVGPTEEEIMAAPIAEETETVEVETKDKKSRGNKAKAKEARTQSKRFSSNASLVSKDTTYPLKNGIEILKKFKKSNFDETVELHVNVKEKGVSGQIVLPHGTGKTLRIQIVDDAIIAEVAAGKINFDILIAEPAMMPKLAKIARVLGPRGLMPNPKNGTISDNPKAAVEKFSKGQVSYKTESAAPLIHMAVGKLSFEDRQIEENVKTVLTSIGSARIEKVTLKSTMSPAVRIQL